MALTVLNVPRQRQTPFPLYTAGAASAGRGHARGPATEPRDLGGVVA